MLTSWFGCVALGAYFALSWAYQPGEGRDHRTQPLAGTGLRAVMLVHPDCPCTEASLNLYGTAVTASKRPIDTLFLIPGQERTSRNIALAKKVPNSRLQFLAEEDINRKFGVSTSGHLLVWNDEKLVFSGGVTDARGEDVRAAAFGELTEAIESGRASRETPVFGCPVMNRGGAK